eukprot:scaffold117691_cov77-Phaeocystis_antarctica.AAC.5
MRGRRLPTCKCTLARLAPGPGSGPVRCPRRHPPPPPPRLPPEAPAAARGTLCRPSAPQWARSCSATARRSRPAPTRCNSPGSAASRQPASGTMTSGDGALEREVHRDLVREVVLPVVGGRPIRRRAVAERVEGAPGRRDRALVELRVVVGLARVGELAHGLEAGGVPVVEDSHAHAEGLQVLQREVRRGQSAAVGLVAVEGLCNVLVEPRQLLRCRGEHALGGEAERRRAARVVGESRHKGAAVLQNVPLVLSVPHEQRRLPTEGVYSLGWQPRRACGEAAVAGDVLL